MCASLVGLFVGSLVLLSNELTLLASELLDLGLLLAGFLVLLAQSLGAAGDCPIYIGKLSFDTSQLRLERLAVLPLW